MSKLQEETATLAAGCFWCTEAIFDMLAGVTSTMSGYSGGDMDNPSYEAVSTGSTNHAEAIQIKFDPAVISYAKLLEVFWKTHDPTTIDQQGSDIGSQYRSVIFYHNEDQRKTAEKSKEEAQEMFADEIVTQIVPFQKFYQAEENHQDFYQNNPSHPYCQIVIDPKIAKLSKNFKEVLK